MCQTKIIATIGPASIDREVIAALMDSVDIFRLNIKHNTLKWHQEAIDLITSVGWELGKPVCVMIDLPNSDMAHNLTGFQMVALSYIREAVEIRKYRERFKKQKGEDVVVVAKIENMKAVSNLDVIIEESDAVMVARGDLGREISLEKLGYWQKVIIERARIGAKPVIVATEMLLSMTENPEPTRAEASDVANAVFDGVDCLMLSNETAIGKYPVESSITLKKFATANEYSPYEKDYALNWDGLTAKILKAGAGIAQDEEIEGIIVFSKSGRSAINMSGFRPNKKLYGVTNNKEAMAKMTLSWGITPILWQFEDGEVFKTNSLIFEKLKNNGVIAGGKKYLLIHGQSWLESGSISQMQVFSF